MTNELCQFFQPAPDKYRTCINTDWHHNGTYRCQCEGETDLCEFWNKKNQIMTAEPLKNCPFCGGKADMSLDDGGYYCKDCGCMPYVEIGEEPADVWNNRVGEPIGNSDELPLWMKEIITEKLMPGSRPWNCETRVIMDTLEWVLSLNKPEKE